ncbi:MAG: J domain-containing protein [Bacteroidota bacterium]
MQLKDYYKILGLEPSATLAEIKKAYRRLAQQYHPDKHSNEEYGLAYFSEIKEAYEVLTNPSKKNDYLQQRWYQQSLRKKEFSTQPVTPVTILKELLDLDKYISGLDIFRMDKVRLYQHIDNLLSDDNIRQVSKFNEQDINNEIVRIVLHTAGYLQLQQAEEITAKLYPLCESEPGTKKKIDVFLRQLKTKNRWEKYRPAIIIITTIIISLLIYFGSR